MSAENKIDFFAQNILQHTRKETQHNFFEPFPHKTTWLSAFYFFTAQPTQKSE